MSVLYVCPLNGPNHSSNYNETLVSCFAYAHKDSGYETKNRFLIPWVL